MASYSRLDDSRGTSEKSSSSGDMGEEELFLRPSDNKWYRYRQTKTWRAWFDTHWRTFVLHLALLSINLTIVTLYAKMGSFSGTLDRVLASNPMASFIRHESRSFELRAIYTHDGDINPHKTNAFNGPPRKELEDEWENLMKDSEVRVAHHELGEFADDDSIIELPEEEGGGFYVTVSVFHGLHCVRRLHQILYVDHYYDGLSDHEKFMLKRHTEHCLDWLKQYVQCHADPTLIPIHWTTNDAVPVSKDIGQRQCVAWEPIQDWMAAHSFDPFKPGMLIHPLFGVPDGVNPNITAPALGAHELGDGALLHADGHKGTGAFD